MNICKDCKHSIFCYMWGEWKCTKKHRRLYSSDTDTCEDFIKTRKGDKKRECNCPVCSERTIDEEDDE